MDIDYNLLFEEPQVIVSILCIIAGLICTIYVVRKNHEKINKNKNNIVLGEIKGINIFPIKSCSGIEVPSARLTPSGLAHGEYCYDRAWAIVKEGVYDNEGKEKANDKKYNCTIMTLRNLPKMALIKPFIKFSNGDMTIRVPAENNEKHIFCQMLVPLTLSGSMEWKCDLFGSPATGFDQGDEVSGFLTSFLNSETPLRLIYMGSNNLRPLAVSPKYGKLARPKNGSRFSDWAQFSMISLQSMVWLNKKIAATSTKDFPDVSLHNFRKNIIISSSSDAPFVEDEVDLFSIITQKNEASSLKNKDAYFRIVKKAGRCTVPTVNPKTGVKDLKLQILKLLKKFRSEYYPHLSPSSEFYKLEPMFGTTFNLTDVGESFIMRHDNQHDPSLYIKIGDKILVNQWKK